VISKISGQDFDREVLESTLPVLVCLGGVRCGSCFALGVIMDDLASEYKGSAEFVMIDLENEPQLAANWRTFPLPAILLFKNGKLQKKLVGFQSKAHLRKMLDALA
jgi:thioredoxin 1